MPTPIIANVAKVTVKGQLFGQDVQNVWYVQTADPPTVSDLNSIAGIFDTHYGTITAFLSQDLSVGEIVVRYMGDIGGPETTLAISPPMTGGEPVGSEPGNVCLCVSLRSALAGRRFRGRKYFSGIPTGEAANNQIDSGVASGITGGITSLIGDLVSSGFPMQVVSFVGLSAVPVLTAVVTDLFVDSQRRRLTGRGN